MLGASRNSLAQARSRLVQLAEPTAGVDLEALSNDLFAIAGLLARELPLRRALADPSTERPAKVALVEALFANRVGAPTLDFLKELVSSRWSRSGDIADAVQTLAVLASFEQALVAGTLDDVEDELFRFGRLLEREAALRDALSDPALAEDRKQALVEGLLTDKVGPVTLRVITAAAVSSRRHPVGESLETFGRLAADLRERLNARVTVAVAPDNGQMERLADLLSRVYGKQIGLRIEVDPQLLGGVVVRVADQVLDASIARRLDLARRGLTGQL